MDIQFLAEADAITLQLERAKRALETAKTDLDLAKKNHDEMLARSEEIGIPKAKLKKLTEERVASLFEIGLLDFAPAAPRAVPTPKVQKVKKAKKEAAVEEIQVEDLIQ